MLGDHRRRCRAAVRVHSICEGGEGHGGELYGRARRRRWRSGACAPRGGCGEGQRFRGFGSGAHLTCTAAALITSAAPGGGSAPAPSASSAGAAELAVPCRPCGHHMAGVAPAGASRRERGSSAQAAERDRVLLEDCIHTRVNAGPKVYRGCQK